MKPKINLIITGGIAAIKSKMIYDLLIKNYQVEIIVSRNAKRFINLVDFKNKNIIFEDIFDDSISYHQKITGQHLKNTQDVALNIVYPATYNFIGKIANGIADDQPSLIFAASDYPTILFPSMNYKMYNNPILKINKEKLINNSDIIWIEPKKGLLASGDFGIGRALEPDEVVNIVSNYFLEFKNLKNKKVLLNLGRTQTKIDPVRYISNYSSGKMGLSLLNVIKRFTTNYKVVSGETDFEIQNSKLTKVKTNQQMYDEMVKDFKDSDIVIATAALTDFEPINYFDQKINKDGMKNLIIKTKVSIDVLLELSKLKTDQLIVAFSLQDTFDLKKALNKMNLKKIDILIINLPKAMNSDYNKIKILLAKNNQVIDLDCDLKQNLAFQIFKIISNYYDN